MRNPSKFMTSAKKITRFACVALASLSIYCTTSAPSYAAPKYSGVVIDAKTGKTLYASNADSLRYPASLTKMMTLYFIFEGLKSGKIKKSTRISVSKFASNRPPSKLGLRPGQTITVESAIYALVTKSANDVASAVGEFFGGSEAAFGRMMTRKARALGMRRTVFRNPHGLPNSKQVTTARDMATLGLALREHFPRYYKYFTTRSFAYGKRRYRNHNKLLGRVRGVDGIKTGYTRASGFNLVSSVRADGRSIVAVVMGGRTGASRNRQMTALIKKYLPRASKRGSGNLVAKRRTGDVQIASIARPRLVPQNHLYKNVPVPAFKPVKQANEESAPAPIPAKRGDDVDRTITTASINSTPSDGKWVIQVASSPSKQGAVEILSNVQDKSGSILASAKPFTMAFNKDGITYHRARFSGFNGKAHARKACRSLKSKRIACYAVRQ